MRGFKGLFCGAMLWAGSLLGAESWEVHPGVGASLVLLTPSSDVPTAVQLALGNAVSLDLSLRLEDQWEISMPVSLQRLAIEARWAPTLGGYWPYLGLGAGFFAYPQGTQAQNEFRGLYYLGCGLLRWGPAAPGPKSGWIVDLLPIRFGPFLFFQEDSGATCLYGRDQLLALGVVSVAYLF